MSELSPRLHHAPIGLPQVAEDPESGASSRVESPSADLDGLPSASSSGRRMPSPFESDPAPPPQAPSSGGSSPSLGGGRSKVELPDTPHMPHLTIRKPKHTAGLLDGDAQGEGELLYCPTMRHQLSPIDSPFLNDRYFGSGFVSDEDRVSLQSLLFATPTSRGVSEVRRSLAKLPGGAALAAASAAPALLRTLSTPRSSVDTNQDAYFAEATPRFALRAGPRATIYYQPQKTRIAILTAGGICPGLNDVIRALVLKALDYGVREGNILGIRHGFKGFLAKPHRPVVLTRQAVEDIHLEGGTMLGTSEDGECDAMAVVKCLDLWAVDMLFVIGGQQEISSAGVIQRLCDRCSVRCAVIALPKSIDNDFLMLDKCFGYETAVEEAQKALLAAHVEASSAYRGIGLVKLMGRHSGFIAVKAALASGLVDIVLVPEVPFDLEAVVDHMKHVLDTRGHLVICMAEGAGQERFPQCYIRPGEVPTCQETDVGAWMKSEIKQRLSDVDCKYIDPSSLIRSIPATSDDRVYAKMIAHGAMHAAFAGYTATAVGQVNTHMCLLPLELLAQAPRQMDPSGELWNRLRAAIAQPSFS